MSSTSGNQVEAHEETTAPTSAARRKRGKARSFDFSAIEHIGNDATEGGFLGDDAAESERRASSAPNAGSPSETATSPTPATENRGSETRASDPRNADAPAQDLAAVEADEGSAGEGNKSPSITTPEAAASSAVSLPNQAAGASASGDQASGLGQDPGDGVEESIIEVEPATAKRDSDLRDASSDKPASRQRRNDGPAFSAASAEPTLKPKRKKASTTKPLQAAVLQSFIKHRTERNWVTWSGRIEGDTKGRLLDKADADAASSKRNLMPGHYLDAALRRISSLSPEELASLANEWLIDKWSGEHPPGVSIQAGVSPETHEFLKGLKRTMRGQRGAGGGIILDVVSAAVDRFLDDAEEEGSFPSAR